MFAISNSVASYVTSAARSNSPENLTVLMQIPYRALLPRRLEMSNLLVPVAVSSSHVGFCAIRLEPTWMVIGQSAGVAASMAATQRIPVHDVPLAELKARLRALGQVLEL